MHREKYRVITAFIGVMAVSFIALSCGREKTYEGPGPSERIAIKKVMETVSSDVNWAEGDYNAVKNPEGPGWLVTVGEACAAKYLVRGDKVYAINGWAMTWSPGIPNVRDAKISDCPNGYIPLKILDGKQKKALAESGIPLEKRKEIYYELIKYQDEHPGEAKKSHRIITERYGITKDRLNLIMDEGFEEGWPQPDYPY